MPEDTPSFGPSYLHSKNWHDRGKEAEPEYGEVWASSQAWRVGNAPNGDCFEPVITGCSVSPKFPKYYRVKLEGVADGLCVDCAAMNNEQILENVEGTCLWTQIRFPYCSGKFARFVLGLGPVTGAPNYTRLGILSQSPNEVQATWLGKIEDWLPFGSNVLGDLIVTSGNCINWPAAVTITPWE